MVYNSTAERDMQSIGYLSGLLDKGRDSLKEENVIKIERAIRKLKKRLGRS